MILHFKPQTLLPRICEGTPNFPPFSQGHRPEILAVIKSIYLNGLAGLDLGGTDKYQGKTRSRAAKLFFLFPLYIIL